MPSSRINVWVQSFKDRPNLMLQWHDPETGKRLSKSAKTDDAEEAENARKDLEYELNHGKHQAANEMTWERFREMFEEEYAAGLRERSAEKYATVFDVFEALSAPAKLRSVNERVLSRFVKAMREKKKPNGKVGLAPITIRNYLVVLKTALQWAVGQKLMAAVPTFPTIKVSKKKPQPIPAEWFDKLLEVAPDDLWKAYLLCAWWAGLRLSEAKQLRWNRTDEWPWLDLPNNRIVLPAKFAKSDTDQSVPLHTTLRTALEALPRTAKELFPFQSRYGGEMSRNAITNRVLAMAKEARVPLSMHRLRKGFGCRVAKQLGKGNAPVLHSLMRHSSMQITMDYYASVDDALQDVMKDLT